ncbi:hypothetical protein B9Z65_4607 [Elsinoe australis]|uniref:C3H1-type domain-containing protein n=1 Tax=Elsinoe australis TaxID=40998 RepID=A0A2P8A5I8_9PEZI|nr:hypothetical protein B9Z65_4607 [Elsinoe australis]
MAPGFSFPPPPPPPPKASGPTYSSTRERGRGRGTRGLSRGRGGGSGARGSRDAGSGFHTASFKSTPTDTQYPPGSYVNPHFNRSSGPTTQQQVPSGQYTGLQDFHGQKRKRDETSRGSSSSCRGSCGQSNLSRPHPMKQQVSPQKAAVAPSVPSFGAPLPFSMSTTSPVSSVAPEGGQSKASNGNSLGLTPGEGSQTYAGSDDSEEDDELDEEAAFRKVCGEKLKFEHNGEIITLDTVADFQAWENERKQLFPTERRKEQKRQERFARIEERRRIEHETAMALNDPPRVEHRHLHAAKGRADVKGPISQESDRAQVLNDQLAQHASQQIAIPTTNNSYPLDTNTVNDEQTNQRTKELRADISQDTVDEQEHEPGVRMPSSERVPQIEDEGSASDASDSSAPEIMTSKVTSEAPGVHVALAKRPCHFFQSTGKCRFGKRCNFEHVRDQSMPRPPMKEPRRRDGTEARKTLYQRLLEQEEDAENRLALQAIKYLGNMGFLRAISTGISEQGA